MSFTYRMLWGAAGGALLVAAGPVGAQTPSAQIDQLQDQIHQLQQQLQSLQTEVNSQAQQAPAPTQAAGPRITQTPGNRFGFESADGQNSIALTGRLHFDVGDYLDYHPDSKAAVQDLNSGVNARRARIGVVGKFAGDWNYSLIFDFGGSTDTGNPSAIENAYVTYNGFKPLAFDLGYMDTPFTLDEATSSNDIMFIERASIQAVATSINTGDFRSAFGARSNNDRYWAGVYLTGPTSGQTHGTGEPVGAFGRFSYQVLQAPNYSFHLGVDASGLMKPAAVGGVRTIGSLSDRPELRIDPTSIIGTGALGTAANPASGAAIFGVETAAAYNSLFLQGEYYHIQVDRDGLPANNFDGGYVEASWTVTGEHRNYIPATGAYSGINPAQAFSLSAGHWGAFELAARYSEVNLDDNFQTGVAVPAGSNGVGGGRQTVYAVGVNWYPNTNMRFMLDYLHGVINKGSSTGSELGGNFDALALRTQIAF